MQGLEPEKTTRLRERFKDIPEPERERHQSFSIRMWRGLSWLERAEQATDLEGRFISLWVAFNAIYGRLDDEGREAGDRASWQSFVARMCKRDSEDLLGRIIRSNEGHVCKLIQCPFLYRPFWQYPGNWQDKHQKSIRHTEMNFRQGNTLPIVQELFERLYVMRLQVFHGAATSGSKLNRSTLETSTHLLASIIPAMIEIMLNAGVNEGWGMVCFPPVT